MIREDPYSPAIRAHLVHPHHRGAPASSTARGEDENPVCGDSMTVWLQVAAGRISGAWFETRGCEPCVAAGSALVQMIEGSTFEQAAMVTTESLDRVLGGVPRVKKHACALAITALRNALAQLHAASVAEQSAS